MNTKLLKKYAIKFNAEYVPTNFDKWIKLDTSEYKKNSIITLNDYSSVIIKSKEKHILLQMGGCNYKIKQNYIYFPFFPAHHLVNLTINPNIDIHTNPICEFNENTELNEIMITYYIIFCGLNIIDYETNKPFESNTYLLSADGMIGLTRKKYIDTDIEKFYYEYEKENNKVNTDKEKIINDINLIDKYYQYEAIKICEFI